jgi:hypothetical protein
MSTSQVVIEPTHVLCGSQPLSPPSTRLTSPTIPNQTQSTDPLLPTPTLSSVSSSIHVQEPLQWLRQESEPQERPPAPTPLLSPMFSPVVPLHSLAQPISNDLPTGSANDVLVENESPFSHVLDAISPHLSSNELDFVPSPTFHEYVVDSDGEQGQLVVSPPQQFQSTDSQETLSDDGEFLSPNVDVERTLFGENPMICHFHEPNSIHHTGDDDDSDSDSSSDWINADVRSP